MERTDDDELDKIIGSSQLSFQQLIWDTCFTDILCACKIVLFVHY